MMTDGLVWQLCEAAPGAWAVASEVDAAAQWVDALVPGTVAQALARAGRFDAAHPRELHGSDFWYRCRLTGQGECLLQFEGLATVAEVHFDGQLLARSGSMFIPLEVPLTLAGEHTLHLVFRSLDAHLASLKLPRARWRVAMVPQQALRGVRTTLLGHIPSWCPAIHAIGPWKPVHVFRAQDVSDVALTASLCGDSGARLHVVLRCASSLAGIRVRCGEYEGVLAASGDGQWQADIELEQVERWWPRGYGLQRLYKVTLDAPEGPVDLGHAGFRRIEVDRDADGRGFALVVNGQRVFARGAVYTPPDLLHPGGEMGVRERLQLLADMGANLVRLAGPFTYESRSFFSACDELGLLVWQDLMLANFDYPLGDAAFVQGLEREVQALLQPLGANPSLAVLCGGSEVHQQAAMLGLPAERQRLDFFSQRLPELCEALLPDLVVVPNSPYGGDLAFSVREGVSHYYGVGAYERPLDDARRATPRFVAEGLALSNVPEPCAVDALGVPAVHHPAWKRGVSRDRNASWDFEDTRDHYLQRVFGLDPLHLRRTDGSRYLQASRALSAHVMAVTLSDWRRPGSPTAGAVVFTAGDLQPGAGWGLIDVDGEPKAAFHGLRQVCQSLALLLTDEGCDGLDIHVVNDTPGARRVEIKVQALRQGSTVVAEGALSVDVAARSGLTVPATRVLGAFFDLTYAFQFGAPGHDSVVVTGRVLDEPGEFLQSVHFPLGPYAMPVPLRLQATVVREGDVWWLELISQVLARFVHIDDRVFRPQENYFHLPPGSPRRILLRPRRADGGVPAGEVTALNAAETVAYRGSL
jgi:beta-mannosidase